MSISILLESYPDCSAITDQGKVFTLKPGDTMRFHLRGSGMAVAELHILKQPSEVAAEQAAVEKPVGFAFLERLVEKL